MNSRILSVGVAGLIAISLSGCSAISAHHRAFVNQLFRHTSSLQNADPISGEWNVKFYEPAGSTAVFKLRLEGNKVTGTAYSSRTGEGTIRDGSWSDGKLSFVLDFKEHKSLVVEGTLKDAKLAGEAHHPEGATYKWEATPMTGCADPVSGEWNVTFYVHEMKTPATFTFKLDGAKVTGTAYSDHTGPGTIRDGKFVDGKLSFTLDFQKHESIVVNGTLKDGQLSGEFSTEGFTDKWEAKRNSQ